MRYISLAEFMLLRFPMATHYAALLCDYGSFFNGKSRFGRKTTGLKAA